MTSEERGSLGRSKNPRRGVVDTHSIAPSSDIFKTERKSCLKLALDYWAAAKKVCPHECLCFSLLLLTFASLL